MSGICCARRQKIGGLFSTQKKNTCHRKLSTATMIIVIITITIIIFFSIRLRLKCQYFISISICITVHSSVYMSCSYITNIQLHTSLLVCIHPLLRRLKNPKKKSCHFYRSLPPFASYYLFRLSSLFFCHTCNLNTRELFLWQDHFCNILS